MRPTWQGTRSFLGAIAVVVIFALVPHLLRTAWLALRMFQEQDGNVWGRGCMQFLIGDLIYLGVLTWFLFAMLVAACALAGYRRFAAFIRAGVVTSAPIGLFGLALHQGQLDALVSSELDAVLLTGTLRAQAAETTADTAVAAALRDLEAACRARRPCAPSTWATIVSCRDRDFVVRQTRALLFRLALEYCSQGFSSDIDQWITTAILSCDRDLVGTALWYLRCDGGPRPVKVVMARFQMIDGIYQRPSDPQIIDAFKLALADRRDWVRSRALSVAKQFAKENEHSKVTAFLKQHGPAGAFVKHRTSTGAGPSSTR
jgi:hypothetical protein